MRGFTLIEMMVVVAIIGIIGVLVFSVSSRPFGASAKAVSDQVVSQINLARLRAQVTRKIQRVQVEPQLISVWELSTTGLAIPAIPVWSLVQESSIPKGASAWNVTAGAITTTGATVTQNASLLYGLNVRPDGQATASTIYLSDNLHQWRVIVYHATGGTYAREGW
ncbi:MAG: prepilin-type N-terminal cleavage/methylation domain-containing protein [Proteobacteria bacterium]|nr:prepilin-type N-terminal cleavage/methylation domain-containing protein [Pseudomonadota bacterium]